MDNSELVAALIFNGITRAATGPRADDAWMRLSERERFAEAVYNELREGGVEVRVGGEPAKPRDLGPQTFGPAPGSDGDTRDWYEGDRGDGD